VSSWRVTPADDGGKRARLAGESTKETVKPLRAGMPEFLVDLWWLTRVFFYFLHARLWVHLGARHSPRPLLGGTKMHNSGDSRRENAELYLAVIASEAKQSSFLPFFAQRKKAGLLRCARNDDLGCLKTNLNCHRPA
jgi:hypothetical protein